MSTVRWRRIQFVELEDLSWFPASWRDAGTGFLEVASRLAGHSTLLAQKVGDALRRTGQNHVVELCSGGGGPMATVMEELQKNGMNTTGILTDLYPNLPALRRLVEKQPGRLQMMTQPVDATAVPASLTGLRVIFNAFHHLDRPLAKKVLADAVQAKQPIAIYELVSREPFQLVALLFSPLSFILTLPMQRPFRWSWLFWTFVVPTIPVFIFWDAIVSWLRIYSVGELQEIVAELDAPGWTWEIEAFQLGGAPARGISLLGYPPS